MSTVYCKRCGSLGAHEQLPGKGPHHARLRCEDCNHIWWIPKPRTPQEQAAREARDVQRRRTIPPTEKQLAYLESLGGDPKAVTSCQEASEAIEGRLRGRR